MFIILDEPLSGAMLLMVPLPMRYIQGVAVAGEMQHTAGEGSCSTHWLHKMPFR